MSIRQSVDMFPAGSCQETQLDHTAEWHKLLLKIWHHNVTCRYFSSALSKNGNLFLSWTHRQSDRLSFLSLSPSFSQCVPNPLVVGVEQVGDQVCSVWTVGVIIQRTAAPCPGTLQQIHYPGTNLKRSNISSILPLLFPLMQYIWNLTI